MESLGSFKDGRRRWESWRDLKRTLLAWETEGGASQGTREHPQAQGKVENSFPPSTPTGNTALSLVSQEPLQTPTPPDCRVINTLYDSPPPPSVQHLAITGKGP